MFHSEKNMTLPKIPSHCYANHPCACTTTDAVVQVPKYKASKHETHTTTALVSIEQMSLILYKMSLTYTLDYLLED